MRLDIQAQEPIVLALVIAFCWWILEEMLSITLQEADSMLGSVYLFNYVVSLSLSLGRNQDLVM
jgi:hypothetical protein